MLYHLTLKRPFSIVMTNLILKEKLGNRGALLLMEFIAVKILLLHNLTAAVSMPFSQLKLKTSSAHCLCFCF